jgi:hypothetical protein
MGKTKEDYIAEYVRGVASKGGKARAQSLSSARRKKIASKAAEVRWRRAKGMQP